MQLLSAAMREAFTRFPLQSQDGKGFDALVVCKFFDPSGRYTYYATEGAPIGEDDASGQTRREEADWEFFGYCVSALGEDCDEWGYATLSELQSVRGRFGLGIERDTSVTPAERTIASFIRHPSIPDTHS